MILKIILIIFLCLLFLLLFYPLRFLFHFTYADGEVKGKASLHPVLMLKKFGFTVYDSEKPKEKKRKKKKKEEPIEEKQEKEKPKREMPPLYEMILHILNMAGKLKKGIKWFRVKLSVSFGFPDPAVTGEVTGGIYAALPWIFGDRKHCRWKIRLYPQWCCEQTVAGVDGDIRICGFDAIFAFGRMLPELWKMIPKKKKKTEEKK